MNNYLAQTDPLDFDAINQQGLGSGFRFSGNTDGVIGRVITDLLPLAFTVAGLILLFMLLSGGFQLMTSRGEPKGVQMGQQRIQYALYGFALIIISFWIVQIIGLLFGINVLLQIFGAGGATTT